MNKTKGTRKARKPRKPHPDCYWSDKYEMWLWPDDRTPAQRKADELAEKAAMSGDWARYGFKFVRSVTAPRRVRSAKPRPRTRRRTA